MEDQTVVGLEARIVVGPKPSAVEAMIEADKRHYGKDKADAFGEGVILANSGRPNNETGKRRSAWVAEGMKWAGEETARRAVATDLTAFRMLSDRQISERGYDPSAVTAACLAADEVTK